MSVSQLSLFQESPESSRERLEDLLNQDLDFHAQESTYGPHNFHAFPAKFPPQLPRMFILGLTAPGDVVLDPMMGSGTTVVEAYLTGRRGIGVDIDPLALKLGRVKTLPLEPGQVFQMGNGILYRALQSLTHGTAELSAYVAELWDAETRQFIGKWFLPATQLELAALLREIKAIADPRMRAFFEIALSAIIITKSGGVSLSFDLAHTRPHKVKAVVSKDGEVINLNNGGDISEERLKLLTKIQRSPIEEFEKRFRQNLKSLATSETGRFAPLILNADAQRLPLVADSVDLIITSPPYAANAIDYMRAHKFSLVWLGYPVASLSKKRKEYIGGEMVNEITMEQLPPATARVVAEIAALDEKKGKVLHRYYSEMTRTLTEMYRVLRPGKTAIVVVGSSTMRGRDTEVARCLADIGGSLGFKVPKIGVRNLDRNRRMMPAGAKIDRKSQIQQRMHEEYVIGLCKPLR